MTVTVSRDLRSLRLLAVTRTIGRPAAVFDIARRPGRNELQWRGPFRVYYWETGLEERRVCIRLDRDVDAPRRRHTVVTCFYVRIYILYTHTHAPAYTIAEGY